MTAFTPKDYQQRVLESVQTYLHACHECGNAADAFATAVRQLWGEEHAARHHYHALRGFEAGMPYFCLRVPTGGGKTWLAAKSIALINRYFLHMPHSVIVWLVPSKTIREQTLTALRNKNHPLHAALLDVENGVEVLDLEEAKTITPAALNTATVVIVATRQAFQVDDTEGRKVYESSGALMAHFENLKSEQRAALLHEGEGSERTTPYSLVNMLRLRRPFIIVDEAHNNRTDLGFETLSRLRPSGIMELTATPDTQHTPSNVLHSVCALELKAEHMIKLPVLLQVEPNWQQCLLDAVTRRNSLEHMAAHESRTTGAPYLRPIVLIQAEPRRAGREVLDTENVRAALLEHCHIPPEEISIATSEERGLDALAKQYKLGLADPACPVNYVITQKALAEGWDCPSAYILVSMAQLSSATAVEQLLGRVLRQPGAKKRSSDALNQSYAFVVSTDFAATAAALRDRLVQSAGFERREAHEYVAAAKLAQSPAQSQELDFGEQRRVYVPVSVTLPEKPALEKLPKKIAAPLLAKVEWEAEAHVFTLHEPLTEDEVRALQKVAGTPQVAAIIAQAGAESRARAAEYFRTPAEMGARFRVPQFALLKQGKLQLFDDVQALDYRWALALHDAAPTAGDMARLNAGMQALGGSVDIDTKGRMVFDFLPELQRDLNLAWEPEHMDAVQLAAWLCRNLPQPRLTHSEKRAFVMAWLEALLRQQGWGLARACQLQFKIRNVLEARINALHRQAKEQAYQGALFDGDNDALRPAVVPECAFDFQHFPYAPSRDDDGSHGRFPFRRHFYGRIGAFDSREEFECACQLDMWAQQGRLEFWVRNLSRQGFFLQKAADRFYPDFLCQLPQTAGGAVLAVEYKGADRWQAAADDRRIGSLWAQLSGGRCRFVMLKERAWEQIEQMLPAAA